jgi:hypothetical protein
MANVSVPEKVIDLIFDLYDLVEPQIKPESRWYNVFDGLPSHGVVCVVKFTTGHDLGIARYDGNYSEWVFQMGERWIKQNELNESVQFWTPLPLLP